MSQNLPLNTDQIFFRIKNISTFAAILILLAVTGCIFFVLPLSDELKDVNIELEEQKALLSESEEKVSVIEKQKSLLASNSLDYKKVLESIPENLNQSALIRDLANLATQHEFTLGSMSFSISKEKPGLNKVIIPISLNGSYEQLIAFLKSIEKSPRFFDIKGIQVQILPDKNEKESIVNFNLNLEAFYQNSEQLAVSS